MASTTPVAAMASLTPAAVLRLKHVRLLEVLQTTIEEKEKLEVELAEAKSNRGARIDEEERARQRDALEKLRQEKDGVISDLERKLKASEERGNALNEQLNDAAVDAGTASGRLQSHAQSLERQLSERDSVIDALREENASLRQDLVAREREVGDVQRSLEQAAAAADAERERDAEKRKAAKAEARRRLAEAEAAAERGLEELRARMQGMVDEESARAEEARRELGQLTSERDELAGVVNKLQVAVAALQQKIRMLEGERRGKRFAEFVDVKRENAQLHQKLDSVTKKRNRAAATRAAAAQAAASPMASFRQRQPSPIAARPRPPAVADERGPAVHGAPPLVSGGMSASSGAVLAPGGVRVAGGAGVARRSFRRPSD